MNWVFRALTAATLLLSGCQQYDIHFNDRLVRAAPILFTDYRIDDPSLDQCVQQAIIDDQVTEAKGLTQLNCSSGGIKTLFGLSRFKGLRQLKLSDNKLRNLVELTQLPELESIWLDGNQVVDPVPVLKLPKLDALDLSHNPRLQCPAPELTGPIAHLTLPEHCLP